MALRLSRRVMRTGVVMRKLLTLVIVIGSAALTFSAPPAFAQPVERSPRVRAADARTAFLLTQGLQRSTTIRALVAALEQRDVIVYIELQPSLRRRLAGTLTWITATPEHRYVRISINPELNTVLAIATMGHELQHALEVATATEVRSDVAMEKFYRLHGDISRAQATGWDTEAARMTGEHVRRELADARSTRTADTTQQFDPEDWLNVYRRARGMLPP
jgi:hypothetical protein